MADTYLPVNRYGKWVYGFITNDHGEQRASVWQASVLDFNFVTGAYYVNSISYPALAAVPGYSYSRTGAMSVLNTSGGLDNFAVNVPPINTYGYHAYDAVTNFIPNSTDLSSWVAFNGATVTADTDVAPDGTTTADTITFGVTASSEESKSYTATGAPMTLAVWGRVTSGSKNFRLKSFDGASTNTYSGNQATNTNWQRFAFVLAAGVSAQMALANESGGGIGSFNAWGMSAMNGNFPEGGPYIPTTGVAASIGAPTLTVSVPNGNYVATFMFDNGTNQSIPVSVINGTYTFPTTLTLNRARITSMVLQ